MRYSGGFWRQRKRLCTTIIAHHDGVLVSAKQAPAGVEMEKRRKGKALFTILGQGGMLWPRPWGA